MTDLERIAREARLGRGNLRRARAAIANGDNIDKMWEETTVLFGRLRRIQRLATIDSAPRGRGMIQT